MRTSTLYVTGLLLLTVHQSCGQYFEFRTMKDYMETSERFNFFDLELLKSVASNEQGNILISPVSVKAALAMVLEGAGGKSAKELREALRLTEDVKETRMMFKNFLNLLQVNTPGTKAEAANQIFMSHKITPHSQYETMLKTNYFSNIEKVDFSNSETAAQTINRWVNMLTHGLIPTLVEPGSLSSSMQLMLANAMYFKGKWKNEFDFDKTAVKCFYVDVNVCLDSYYMESANIYKAAFIPSLNAQALELPYEGSKFSLMLLMPSEVNGIQQLVRDLNHISMSKIVSSLEEKEMLITVPKFKIDYNTDLLSKLEDLGIKEIFTPHANLSGMVQMKNLDLHISTVLHKAIIDVNEEGTIASAATGTIIVPLMGATIPKLHFNHPFLFFLRNTESGDILFAGRLSQPEEAKPPNAETPKTSPPPTVLRTGPIVFEQTDENPVTMPHSNATPQAPFLYFSRNLNAQQSAVNHMTAEASFRSGQYAPNTALPTQQNMVAGIMQSQSPTSENSDKGYGGRIHFE